MTKLREADRTTKPIEVTFTPCDLVHKDGDVPILKTLGFHELTRHQTEEFDRVGRELNERVEGLFQEYGISPSL